MTTTAPAQVASLHVADCTQGLVTGLEMGRVEFSRDGKPMLVTNEAQNPNTLPYVGLRIPIIFLLPQLDY